MNWTRHWPLRFSHCDPAGIAYYPKLFEMLDNAIEEWTSEVIGVPRDVMHRDMDRGMPTVTMAARFEAVSYHGDMLDIVLDVTRVGRSSVDFTVAVSCAGRTRFAVDYRQVFADQKTRRALPWPDDLRSRLENRP